MGMIQRKEEEKLIRKNDIIKAAEDIFLEKSFEQTTMDDIAKKAEFTKKTLYSYFKSKDEIYYEITLKAFNVLNSTYDEILEKNEEKSELQKIKLLGETFVNFSITYPVYFKAIADYEAKDINLSVNCDQLTNECFKAGQYSMELLKQCIAKGIEKGEISNKNCSDSISLVLWSCILGFINILSKKQQFIEAYYGKNASELMNSSMDLILNSIKSL